MLTVVLRRLVGMATVMFIVATMVFFLTRLAPGDPAALMLGDQATPDDVAGIVHAHPTLGESIAEANWALAGRGLHTPA